MTNTRPIRVLLVEDNPGDVRLASEMLKVPGQARYEQIVHERLSAALEYLDRHSVDVVLLDLSLPDSQGLETLTRMQRANPELPIVILSGLADEQVALSAVQLGAQDYIVKGHKHGDIMARSIRYAIERKRGHLSLVEALEKAELASRSKSEFLANMSHELRTPLNAIMGFSELIAMETFGKITPAKYAGYVNDIHQSASYLMDIISDILDISKIESGKHTLNEENVDVGEIVKICNRLITPRAEENEIELVFSVQKALPALYADECAVKQILINLLGNAVKFNPGSRVEIDVRVANSGELVISIADNGAGIAAQDLPTVLEPFVQIENAFTRQHEGTGLGLPLSVGLAEAHGGSLTIESAVGVGTKVTVQFPKHRVLNDRRAA
ncbi:MAG: ATP-binding protein [Planctomycetota bacterium]|nr:ATP-binding protein [Planctomycetota bacterium]